MKVKQTALTPQTGYKPIEENGEFFAGANYGPSKIGPFKTMDEASKWAKDHSPEGQPVHYFDIPPELAAQATGKGMPLFVGGLPVVPVNHDPFEEKKK